MILIPLLFEETVLLKKLEAKSQIFQESLSKNQNNYEQYINYYELFIGQIYAGSAPQYEEQSHKKSVTGITL